jgi:hypothetical protein
LGWQYFTSLDARSGWGWVGLISYDKEVFIGVALVTLRAGCQAGPGAALALASSSLDTPFNPTQSGVSKAIFLPKSWQDRIKQTLRETKERAEVFYKIEGEKAMKALRESPVPQKSIVPVQ